MSRHADITFSLLVTSTFLAAGATFSSFLGAAVRERLFLSPLRSSFNFSAATFLVAPAMACSSRILYTSSSFLNESAFLMPSSLAIT